MLYFVHITVMFDHLRAHLPQGDSCLVIICRHYMMDLTVKDIVRRTSFLFYFMFSELLFVLFPISLFELSFFCLLAVCLLLSIWSVGWKLKSATTFCPCVPFVVIHSLLHCYSRFLFCIILFWTFHCAG